jgi:hypothetical protein
MTKLSKLFRDIESFYRNAVQAYSISKYSQQKGYVSPDTDEETDAPNTDDNTKYTDLITAAQQISDPSLSSELLLIAEMYKKAIELGGGYSSINRAISNIINMYLEDEDDPEQSSVEDLLNEVVKDLRARAGGAAALNKPDSPEAVAQLRKFKDEFNNRAVQEEIEDLGKYEDKAVPTFDPTGGMDREKAQKGAGRGYYVKTVKSLKDWVEHYRNEEQRYGELSHHNDRLLKPKVTEILKVLKELINKLVQFNQLQKELSASPDPDKQAQLTQLQEEIRVLREKRSQIRSSLRRELLGLQKNDLEAKLKNAPNARTKFRLEQEIELKKLLASQDKNKGTEVKLRKTLINSMSNGNYPGEETIESFKKKIQEAATLKIPIEQIRKEQAKNIKEKFEYDPNKGRQGRIRVKTLEGLIINLGQKLATQKIVVKQTVTDKLQAEEHNIFQTYLNKIAEAKKLNSPEAVKAATKELHKAMNDYAEDLPPVIAYKEAVKVFYDLKKQISLVEKSKLMESQGPIPMEIAAIINNMIKEGRDLIARFSRVNHFDTIVAATGLIIDALEQRINQ